jgi:elongation factor G
MGELHLEIVREFLERDFKVEARFGKPRVSYREKPLKESHGTGVLEQKIGDRQIFAEVSVRVEPVDDNRSRMRALWETPELRRPLPPDISEAVEEGIAAAAGTGPLMGEPVVGSRAFVTGLKYDENRGQPGAFSAAAARAVEQALDVCGTQLLEPVMRIEVLTPEEYLGNIVNDFGVRKAQVARTDVRGELRLVEAYAALEDMFGYAGTLRSLSSGRASCTMEPHDYRPVPEARLKRLLAI